MPPPLDIPIGLPDQRRIDVTEYHRMADAGVFGPDERVELLEGVLIRVPPQGEPHAWPVQELTRLLVRALPDGYRVRPQLPITLGRYSEPEPDLAIVTLDDGDDGTEHPEAALLVIEVAVSSLRLDRTAKAPVYARAGIPEYWIVDVKARTVEVHRDPDPARARYRSVVILGEGDALECKSAPLPLIPIAAILPRR